ncbi:MAG: peptidoglycan DD-metalloendopeptidase family protein [Gammaproteobacteria bacterium]|nr:peptidoglycan DD-metalloendopeptidase family protein [Gammaproteobacteria bacterium]NNC98456.1 peptidoglycan DD-metalloendopeptidase family protein [Gammaproteobacteria bacterium]NNM14763.1 peptidoglycan DD-metalloendopeptidase family protein [Gammaproteobacteria bacterium]
MQKFVSLLIVLLLIGACAHSPSATQQQSQTHYKVKSGESMASIAADLNIPFELLRRSNPWLDPSRIKPDMKLLVPDQRAVQRYQAELDKERHHQMPIQGHIWPLQHVSVSSPYGPRKGRMHKGIDLRAPIGTPILATNHGKVVFSGVKGGYGNLVVVDHGYGVHTAYAHNSSNLVKKGQRVTRGQTIAKVGQTGKATGPHVHYEIRRNGKAVNPTRHMHAAL